MSKVNSIVLLPETHSTEGQAGYIKCRFIVQNIRNIENVVYFTETENLPGIKLTIDLEKVFDLIRWNFM